MNRQYENLNRVWQLIVSDVRASQLGDGSTRNPVVKTTYPREAAFSASILAANYRTSSASHDLELANRNISFLNQKITESGVIFDEPIWTPRGENIRRGSLPATVYLFEALDAACIRLDKELFKNKHNIDLLKYLENCEIRQNIFAHDEIRDKNENLAHPVINTSLMAIWLRQQLTPANDNIEKIDNQLKKHQRNSGLWPYLYSRFLFERILDRFVLFPKKSKFILILRKLLKDRSFFFSDFHHHAVCLQYYLKCSNTMSPKREKNIMKAWHFIESKFLYNTNQISLDFSWEPQPNFPRYSNFKDTTTYFIVMEILYLFHKRNIFSKDYVLEISEGFCAHILQNLIVDTNTKISPRIPAYEGSIDEIELIFPRPAESVHHKGHLMSNMYLLSTT